MCPSAQGRTRAPKSRHSKERSVGRSVCSWFRTLSSPISSYVLAGGWLGGLGRNGKKRAVVCWDGWVSCPVSVAELHTAQPHQQQQHPGHGTRIQLKMQSYFSLFPSLGKKTLVRNQDVYTNTKPQTQPHEETSPCLPRVKSWLMF